MQRERLGWSISGTASLIHVLRCSAEPVVAANAAKFLVASLSSSWVSVSGASGGGG
jgi:hypothetical protein